MVAEMVDSGVTVCNSAGALKAKGAKAVYAYVVHGVLSGEAVNRVRNSPLEKLVITDSIQATDEVLESSNIEQVSIAPLIGEAVRRVSEERSISELF